MPFAVAEGGDEILTRAFNVETKSSDYLVVLLFIMPTMRPGNIVDMRM